MSLIEWKTQFVFEHNREPSDEETETYFNEVVTRHFKNDKEEDPWVVGETHTTINFGGTFAYVSNEMIQKHIKKLSDEELDKISERAIRNVMNKNKK